MKAVITGANSFIGQRLTNVLYHKGWDIIQVVRRPFPCENGIQQVYLPMEEYGKLGEITGGCDCFVHLAWNGTRGATRMDKVRQENNLFHSLEGVRSMLQVGCGRLITAGSQAEYGPSQVMITEETPCAPNTEYGKAKLAFYEQASKLCITAGVDYKEPRFFSLYGPDDYEGTMIVSVLKEMLKNRPCRLTQGVQMWDFLYIEDAVDALVGLCEKACSNGVYNFGSGDVRQLKEYILEMAEITNTKSELQFGAIPYPDTGMVSLWPDISKLKKELDWSPQVRFAEGIQTVLAALQRKAMQ